MESRSFLSTFWDRGDPLALEAELMRLYGSQIQLAAASVPYWRDRIPPAIVEGTPLSRPFIERLPIIRKQDLRLLGPFDLVPSGTTSFHMYRGTGGTTGTPVDVLWTLAEWTASMEVMARHGAPLAHIRPLRIWNGYHQGHVSGPVFDDTARLLGGTPFPRHFRSSDEQALQEIEHLGANVLVLTPKSGSGKGGSLEDLLAIDPDFLRRLKIQALMVSSTPLDPNLLDEVREQGVEHVVNYYGSTEALPSAVSCAARPTWFHLCQGHLFVEVVAEDGRHVRSGERGAVVVSRIAGRVMETIEPGRGMQLFRFEVGDFATFLDESCPCGRTTPRIGDIVRMKNVEDKLSGGCELWE